MASTLSSPSRRVQPTQCAVEVFQEGWWSAWVKRVLVLRSGQLLVYDEGVANCLATIRLGQIVKTAVPKSTDGHEFQFIVTNSGTNSNNSNSNANSSSPAAPSSASLWRCRCGSEEELTRVYSALRAHIEHLSARKHAKQVEKESVAAAAAAAVAAASAPSTPLASNVAHSNNDDNSPSSSASAASSSSASSSAASRRRRTLSRRLSLTDLGQAFIPTSSESIAAPQVAESSTSIAVAPIVSVASIAAGTASVEPQLAEELERRLNARMSVAAQQRIATLEELNARLTSDNHALLKQLADDADRETDLRKQLAAAASERDACEERVRVLEAVVDVYRFNAATNDAVNKALNDEVRSLQHECESVRATRDTALENAQLTEASMRAATEQIVVLNREVGALQGVIAKGTQPSSSDVLSPNDDLSSLAAKLAAKAEACLALKSHASFLGAQLTRNTDEQRRRTALRQETIRRLRAQLATSNARASATQMQSEALRARLPVDEQRAALQLAAQVAAQTPPTPAAERTLDDLDDLRSELSNLRREHFHALVLSIKLAMSREGMPINIDPSVLYEKMQRDKPEGLPVAQWPAYIHALMTKIVQHLEKHHASSPNRRQN
jgi:hypothetical protein